MSFDTLPVQNIDHFAPRAKAYSVDIVEMSRKAAMDARYVADLPYGDDPRQQLDLYLPKPEGLHDLPVMIFLHGGGWEFGFKEQMGFLAPPLLSLPAILVSINYRLVPEHRFPAALHDTVAAIRWVFENVANYGGSPRKIVIGGHSAGGHLAVMATLRGDLLAGAGLPADVIKGCLPVSATFQFDVGQMEREGKAMFTRPDDAVDASPLSHVAGARTPFFVTWGSDDFDRVRKTSPEIVAALQRKGTPVQHHVFGGYDHFETNLDQGNPEGLWVQRARMMMSAS